MYINNKVNLEKSTELLQYHTVFLKRVADVIVHSRRRSQDIDVSCRFEITSRTVYLWKYSVKLNNSNIFKKKYLYKF